MYDKWYNLVIRMCLTVFVFVMLSVVGGLAIQGGDRMETENPNAFDMLGGYWIIHFFFESFLIFWLVITAWIMIIGNEKEIWRKITSKNRGKNATS